MKSYLLPTYIPDAFEDAGLSSGFAPDFYKRKYRNLMGEFSFHQTNYLPDNTALTRFIADSTTLKNLKEVSNTKEIVFNRESPATSGFRGFHQAVELYKQDSEGYNTIFIKINKLNEFEMTNWKNYFRLGGLIYICFSDTANFKDIDQTTNLLNAPGLASHPSPLTPITVSIGQRFINIEEGYIMLDPSFFASIGLVNRSSVADGKAYHRYFAIFNPYNPFTSQNKISFGNFFVGNPIEVEFENGIAPKVVSRTSTVQNENGIDFKSVKNTQKFLELNIPLITSEKFIELDTNFFKKQRDLSFVIMPITGATSNPADPNYILQMENKNLGGHYQFDGVDYTYERLQHNIYNINLKCKEVI